MSDELAETVRGILDQVPGSDYELARTADVPQSTVSRIRHGKRGCTPDVARRLARALDLWSDECADARDRLRRALEPGGGDV